MDKFQKCFPGANYSVRDVPISSSGFTPTMRNREFRHSSKWLFVFLKNLGWVGRNSYGLRVPRIIMEGSSAEVAAFLRAYFEGDGSISLGLKGDQERRVVAVSASSGLLDDVKLLLTQHFGVLSSRLGLDAPTWRLNLLGQEPIFKFAQTVGFLSDRKNQRLPTCVLRTGGPSRTDILPQVKRHLQSHRAAATSNPRKVVTEAGAEVMDYTAHMSSLSIFPDELPRAITKVRGSLPLLAKSYPTLAAKLQEVVDRNYFYAAIESVLPAGVADAYGISVAGAGSLTANGFVVRDAGAMFLPC